MTPRDDDRKMREKVTGKLLSLDQVLEPTLPVFLSLLDAPVGDAEWTKLDPSQRRRQTLDALKRLMLHESQQPVLLVVEDLHWIDSETQAWLDLLTDSLPTTRLLLGSADSASANPSSFMVAGAGFEPATFGL